MKLRFVVVPPLVLIWAVVTSGAAAGDTEGKDTEQPDRFMWAVMKPRHSETRARAGACPSGGGQPRHGATLRSLPLCERHLPSPQPDRRRSTKQAPLASSYARVGDSPVVSAPQPAVSLRPAVNNNNRPTGDTCWMEVKVLHTTRCRSDIADVLVLSDNEASRQDPTHPYIVQSHTRTAHTNRSRKTGEHVMGYILQVKTRQHRYSQFCPTLMRAADRSEVVDMTLNLMFMFARRDPRAPRGCDDDCRTGLRAKATRARDAGVCVDDENESKERLVWPVKPTVRRPDKANSQAIVQNHTLEGNLNSAKPCSGNRVGCVSSAVTPVHTARS
ncbi:hypothetical protein Bbelb_380830 [Branchiostoma belcheri]|nr:hypothetical protein Bbelb_380830 [Branchiostoma belcheri]